MKVMAPDYYAQFRCIADQCRHSCCVGWEIDIDPDTREYYRCVPGAFGERLNAAIDDGEEASCFRLGEGERCPMLNECGLCDLITELGEDALCQICADHPRFRNEFSGRTEIGLGLCCEEAARLILSREDPVTLVTMEDDGEDPEEPADPVRVAVEASLLGLRDIYTGMLQDRELPILGRIDAILQDRNPVLLGKGTAEWAAVFRGLERLDRAWDAVLDTLEGPLSMPPDSLDTALEQFAVYMLYRHAPGALEDGDFFSHLKLACYATLLLFFLCAARTRQQGGCTLEDCIEFARMFSAEVEYSEENIDALLTMIREEDDA